MTDATGEAYQPWPEWLAIESVGDGYLDPDKDVPFAVLSETYATLTRLGERELRGAEDHD